MIGIILMGLIMCTLYIYWFCKRYGVHIEPRKEKAVEFWINLQRLPYLETEGYGEEFLHVTDSCYEYIPTLAKFEGKWAVDWVHFSECDSIKVITGNTPVEAVNKAIKWCEEKKLI